MASWRAAKETLPAVSRYDIGRLGLRINALIPAGSRLFPSVVPGNEVPRTWSCIRQDITTYAGTAHFEAVPSGAAMISDM